MKFKHIFFALAALLFSVAASAQVTKVTADRLVKAGGNSTFLTTTSGGATAWGNLASLATGGTGISISGNTITNSSPDQTVALTGAGITAITGTYPNFTITSTEVDGSVSNEGSITVGAGTSTTSLLTSNTSGSTAVTLTAGTGLSIAETGNVITLTNSSPDQTVALTGAGITAITGTYPNFTITSTEVDGSTSNELQTVSAGDGTGSDRTIVLSNSGGTITLAQGSGIVLTRSTNTITIAASSSLPTIVIARYEEVTSGSTTTITVTGFTPLTTDTMVFVDGIMMDWGSGEDITVSGSVITFATALVSGQKVVVKKITAT
jgi:hypothetical protein